MSVASRGLRRSNSQAQLTRSTPSTTSSIPQPPCGHTLTPSNDNAFEGCTATDRYFLYAQRNTILCLEHDTLAIARRFERHKEDVLWIAADNVSDRGAGRLVVSYDGSLTTIVWDVITGDEIARFASYEIIQTASWMRNSNIAFGNSQGNVILFEPSTSEHISARTIFDPITALAPAADCRTFALGYMNGSILIATLQPSFTILHTLSTNRAPSPLNRLSWHGSSSKQKSDMLAAQTRDGDLRVWSVPKQQGVDQPSVIRVLSKTDVERMPGLCWFAWSKMGRIVQYSEGQTTVWDVRTKRVTYESVPTVDGVLGITNHGPSAKLFTLGRSHTVQQYDLTPNPNARPMLVQNVQHVPAKLPPSPPISDGLQEASGRYVTVGPTPAQQDPVRKSNNLPLYLDVDTSDAEEGVMRSPLQRLSARADDSDVSEADVEEGRDRLGPLSPVSSRASTTSRSSRGGGQRRQEPHPQPRPASKEEMRRERPNTPGSASYSAHSGSTHTTFSTGPSSARIGYQQRVMRESVSTRSLLSASTSASKTSRLRQEVLRSPEETKNTMLMDLFPHTKAMLAEVPFRPPQYDQSRCTPDDLRRQMLEVVFGWGDDIEALVRDELAHHRAGSASGVMLAKWLGDLGADIAASMVGSESMTSADWMLLALSSMGQDSQKKIGETFVQRLLEKGDIHPAVSILLGLGEYNDAVEVYVSRKYFMEAVLLTCLLFPTDWQRISYLVRKWGEIAVAHGEAELAVRCFSCTSMQSSEPWFSPRAQDEVYAMQQRILAPDTPSDDGLSPHSPRSAGGGRLLPSQAGLKLVTTFNQAGDADPTTVIDDRTPMNHGATPIDAALSPVLRRERRGDPTSALSTRTATPGGFSRTRMPSSSRATSSKRVETPQVRSAATDYSSAAVQVGRTGINSTSSSRARSTSASQTSASYLTGSTYPAEERGRAGLPSPAHDAFDRFRRQSTSRTSIPDKNKEGLMLRIEDVIEDPAIPSSIPTGTSASEFTYMTAGSPSVAQSLQGRAAIGPMDETKIRSIDAYIHSLKEASYRAGEASSAHGPHNKARAPSRTNLRAPSESRGRSNVTYIRPAKRSPSSPVSMSPDDPALQVRGYEDAESYYKSTSMSEPSVRPRARVPSKDAGARTGPKAASRERTKPTRSRSRPIASCQQSEEAQEREGRGRTTLRNEDGSGQREPSSPRPMSPSGSAVSRSKVGEKVRERSISRAGHRRAQSPEQTVAGGRRPSKPAMPRLRTNLSENNVMVRTRKELAAQDLEARRLSLMRRPSAPPVIHPDQIVPKSAIEPTIDPNAIFSVAADIQSMRGHTADPHVLRKYANEQSGTPTKAGSTGLPATPRAMRHPKDTAGSAGNVPAVPEILPPFTLGHSAHIAGATATEDSGNLFTLLPTSTYKPPIAPHLRSASAPPEKYQGHQRKISSRSHSRQNSRDNIPANAIPVVSPGADGRLKMSIDEAIRESQVIIIDNPDTIEDVEPPLLPELQHLSSIAPPPPPPPPPPIAPPQHHSLSSPNPAQSPPPSAHEISMSDDERQFSPPNPTGTPSAAELPDPFSSPSPSHRRGRGSISESIGNKLRGLGGRTRERDRSGSRQRPVISPPVVKPAHVPAPYESVPQATLQRRPSTGQGYMAKPRVPYELIGRVASPGSAAAAPAPAPAEPTLLPSTTYTGYRNPKEIARQLREREEAAIAGMGRDGGAGGGGVFIERAATAPPVRSGSRVRANMPPGWREEWENQI